MSESRGSSDEGDSTSHRNRSTDFSVQSVLNAGAELSGVSQLVSEFGLARLDSARRSLERSRSRAPVAVPPPWWGWSGSVGPCLSTDLVSDDSRRSHMILWW